MFEEMKGQIISKVGTYSFQWIFLTLFAGTVVSRAHGDHYLEPSPPSLLQDLQADCTKDGINVKLWFKEPFTGVAYSNGHYEIPKCRYISHEDQLIRPSGTNFSFLIPVNECGTVYHGAEGTSLKQFKRDTTHEKTNDNNEVYIENTLLIQNDPTIQEAGDLAKTLRCVWQKEIHKPLVAAFPFGSVKPKLTPTRFETEKIPGIAFRNKTNYRVGSAFSKGRLRFQMKGQVQSVPAYGRRHYSRALSAGDDEGEYSSVEIEVEDMSSEEDASRLRDHDDGEIITQVSSSALALPLQSHHQDHVRVTTSVSNDGYRNIFDQGVTRVTVLSTLTLLTITLPIFLCTGM